MTNKTSKETAREIRTLLKDKFPNTKFKVTSGKEKVNIRWDDGQAWTDVTYAVKNYDSNNHSWHYLFGNDIHYKRTKSLEFLRACTEKFCNDNNIPVYEVRQNPYTLDVVIEGASKVNTLGNSKWGNRDDDDIWELASKATFSGNEIIIDNSREIAKQALRDKIAELKEQLELAEIELAQL